ncbi:D-tyrosyl-tRNA(Tyr) deacylase [bacterium]|nr:D-tyrosyl-tRNA(Tyr) deacylase [bacterium]
MRALIQRVVRAQVAVDGEIIGSIGTGMVILLGVAEDDSEADAVWLAEKCANLRIFDNNEGKFHYSLLDIEGEALIISQFTLMGNSRKGRRPSFTQAAKPDKADLLYQFFIRHMKNLNIHSEIGRFAAHMLVSIDNDGPVTLIIDSEESR